MSSQYRGQRRVVRGPDAETSPASRALQLLIIAVFAIPFALIGARVGMSVDLDGVNPPSGTLPEPPAVLLPPLPATDDPSPSPSVTSASPAPATIPAPTSGATTRPAVVIPTPVTTSGPPPLVLDNFDSPAAWQAELNDLDRPTQSEAFVNGGGRGEVGGGALTLVYSDDGWFGSDVKTDVSRYQYLVLRIVGATGGEERQLRLTLGGVTHFLYQYTLDGGAHPAVTRSYQNIRIPMSANGIDAKRPGELQLDFWWGGHSTVVIDEIRFE